VVTDGLLATEADDAFGLMQGNPNAEDRNSSPTSIATNKIEDEEELAQDRSPDFEEDPVETDDEAESADGFDA
jgi:hypothetical protein